MRRAAALVGLVMTFTPLAATAQGPSQLIPGDGDWRLYTVPSGGCYARLAGRDVDTMVMVNRFSKPVIAIGRADWNFGPRDITVGLRIDMRPVRQVTVSPVGNIALFAVTDDLRDAVLGARTLTWTLPTGAYTAPVAGLGKAFQAVVPSASPPRRRRRPQPRPPPRSPVRRRVAGPCRTRARRSPGSLGCRRRPPRRRRWCCRSAPA